MTDMCPGRADMLENLAVRIPCLLQTCEHGIKVYSPSPNGLMIDVIQPRRRTALFIYQLAIYIVAGPVLMQLFLQPSQNTDTVF